LIIPASNELNCDQFLGLNEFPYSCSFNGLNVNSVSVEKIHWDAVKRMY